MPIVTLPKVAKKTLDCYVILYYSITKMKAKSDKTLVAASKMTSKHQATIPEEIRDYLGLDKGDHVAFEIKKGKVVLRRISPLDVEFAKSLQRTLSEWESDNDEEAYRDL